MEAQRECYVKNDDVIISTTTFSSNMFYIQWMTNMSLWRSGLQIEIYLISKLNAKLQLHFKYIWRFICTPILRHYKYNKNRSTYPLHLSWLQPQSRDPFPLDYRLLEIPNIECMFSGQSGCSSVIWINKQVIYTVL